MSFTTPLFVPLQSGLDLSKESTLGEKDLAVLENADFAVDGAIQGRPARSLPVDVVYRNSSSTEQGPAYTQGSFASSGFTYLGLMRLRDSSGERPMLGTAGRLFSLEGSLWEDRGHFGCMRHDKLVTMAIDQDPTLPPVIAQDFYRDPTSELDSRGRTYGTGPKLALRLLDSDFSAERSVTGTTYLKWGGGAARCGNYTATVFQDASTGLWIALRNNGATTVSEVQIASDCGGDWLSGKAAQICCDFDETHFYVVYLTTDSSNNQYKVLRVDTAGTVSATFTGSQANLQSFWVTNLAAATNKVVVAVSHTAGVLFKVLTASTMVDASLDSTYAMTDVPTIVVGAESATRIWFAAIESSSSGGSNGLHIGTVNPASASSAVLRKQYLTGPTYSIVHQPIRCGGRMYITVSAGWQRQTNYDSWGNLGTSVLNSWVTLDLSNLNAGTTGGPFSNPTLVARGEADTLAVDNYGNSSVFYPRAWAAVPLSDGSGWTFPTSEWTSFSESFTGITIGYQPARVLNRIKLSGPRAVQAGGITLLSGSVPRELGPGGDCYETGFLTTGGIPLATPTAVASGSGYLSGDYSFVACWKYTDSAGQVHRSWPSTASTITVNGTTNKYATVEVMNPIFFERPASAFFIEVYMTVANPTSDAAHYLQKTVPANMSTWTTTVTIGSTTAPIFTGLPLYTDGAEFGNQSVPADGGIAAVGNRVWLATANSVYASKLLRPGEGPAWNDEGSLRVDLPAGAGRIVALEGLDDKLVVFCERGVFAIPDGGPDNTGNGPDVATPIRLSDLGCAGPRSTCVTDRGVVFCSPLDSTDAQRGGPWLLDRSLSFTERTYLGRPAFTYLLGSGVPELAYSPERQQLYVTAATLDSGLTGVIVIDFRVGKWSTWSSPVALGSLRSITCASGILWSLATELGGYNQLPGSDKLTDVSVVPTRMVLKTQHIASNGQDGLGWGRVRSVSVMHAEGSGNYSLDITATLDYDRTLTSSTFALASQATAATTWPSNRQAPEWRLPQQKCGTIQLKLTASDGTARWSAIRLDVVPLPGRAPAKDRA